MASNGSETRTLIRSVIDALSGTSSTLPIAENEKEDSSESDPEANEDDYLNQLKELGEGTTDSQEVRYSPRVELGRPTNLGEQEFPSREAFELTDSQEIRYASRVELGRSANLKNRETQAKEDFARNGSSTDPRIPF
jgi:hypothetical protein